MGFARPVQRSVIRRGFTVVEILVVLGIVIGVISTLIVGLGYGARRARIANTEFLMNSIVAGLTRFRAETGYMPPILGVPSQVGSGVTGTAFGQLGWCRDMLDPPSLAGTQNGGPTYGSWSTTQRQNLQKWCSGTTIPEYLLGLGDRSQDGYGVIMEAPARFRPIPTLLVTASNPLLEFAIPALMVDGARSSIRVRERRGRASLVRATWLHPRLPPATQIQPVRSCAASRLDRT